MSSKLIVSIVPHNCGELVTKAARDSGAGGGTIMMGRGTASSNILQLLGLGDTSKDVTYNIVECGICGAVIEAIKKMAAEKKAHFGVLFSLDIKDFFRSGFEISRENNSEKAGDYEKVGESNSTKIHSAQSKGESDMGKSYTMINVIVNKGYAEDAMAAAREAGAGGGTIMNGRGTARPDDKQFMGITIVPEKEILMILVEKEKVSAVKDAIRNLPCFAEKGSGIIFDAGVDDFTLLGK